MKPFSVLAGLAAAALLAAGCAAPDESVPQPRPSEKYYRTGSNLPVKDAPPPPMTEEERERAADAMRRATQPRPPTN